jgi:hypothetical protein
MHQTVADEDEVLVDVAFSIYPIRSQNCSLKKYFFPRLAANSC